MADLLKQYRARIVREGALKALFLGLVFGSSALALCTLLSWFFGFGAGLWIGIALFAVLTATVSLTMYFVKYKPNTKAVAERIDALGLEERVLTMTELEGDDSYIAKLQREDTERALGKVDSMMIKLALSAALCIAAAVCLVFGLGGTTVGSLYNAGVIPSGMELISDLSPAVTFKVSYTVQRRADGVICLYDEAWGEPEFLESGQAIAVEEGQAAPAVYALDGPTSVFVGWSDGVTSRYRRDENITKDLAVIALYTTLTDEELPADDPMLEEGGSGSMQMPGDVGNSDNAGDDEKDPDPDGSGGGGGEGGDDAGGSHSAANQQIVDGETYYGDRYEAAYQDMLDRLNSDDTIPDDLKEWILEYFESIRTGGSGNQNQ